MSTKEKVSVKTDKGIIRHSFYGGKVIVEAMPWRDTYRYTVEGRC